MSRPRAPAAPAGFTLVELMVVISIVGLLATAALDRYWALQEMAERAAMEESMLGLRSATRLKTAEWIMQGRGAALAELLGQNPFDWLEQRPGNYGGVVERDNAELARGYWYYRPSRREVVYTVRRDGGFSGSEGPWLRLGLVPVGRDGRRAAAPPYYGITLVPLSDSRWLGRHYSPPAGGGGGVN